MVASAQRVQLSSSSATDRGRSANPCAGAVGGEHGW
jgi:hypothetical protein